MKKNLFAANFISDFLDIQIHSNGLNFDLKKHFSSITFFFGNCSNFISILQASSHMQQMRNNLKKESSTFEDTMQLSNHTIVR